MTVKVILNPYAGRWQAQARKDELEVALHEQEIDFELDMTDGSFLVPRTDVLSEESLVLPFEKHGHEALIYQL